METNKQKEFLEALAASTEIYLKSIRGIQEETKRLKEQLKLAEQDYKERNKSIQEQFNAPTEHSIACRRKQQAYNLKRSIGLSLLVLKSISEILTLTISLTLHPVANINSNKARSL